MTLPLSRYTRRRAASKPRRLTLSVELLENRTVPTGVPAPSGLVSWWTANSTVADLVGNNNGTLNNGVTYATGEVGQAFSFNTTDSVTANTTALPTGNSNRTMEMWVNVTAFGPGETFFAGYGNFGSAGQTYHLGTDAGSHDLFFSQWGEATSGPALQAGQWYHIAVTNVGNSGTLYLNGVQVATGTLTIATPPNTQFYIGRLPDLFAEDTGEKIKRQLDGLVDEVTVYNRALTAAEIQSIYAAGSAGKIPPPVVVTSPSVIDGSGGATTPVNFTITRPGSLSGSLTVNYTTADDTAVAGTDYLAASGTVMFADGQATQTVTVTSLDTNVPKPNIDFKLIATPAGGTSFTGVATILNDDASIAAANDSATEGGTAIRPLGAFVPANFGGLGDAYALIYGPDGNVYVSTLDHSAVYRYDVAGNPLPAPGQSGAVFVAPGSGGLSGARDIAFGPDGFLYVASEGTGSVLRYDPGTGLPAGTFIAPGSGGLEAARGLLFRNGYLYVTSAGTMTGPGENAVLRYDATTGASAGVSEQPGDAVFIASGSGGLAYPNRIVFGPDGRAYVASVSSASNAVLRYDGTTGNFVDTFVAAGSGGLNGPIGMVFRNDGYFYVVGYRSESVLRYQASTGAFVGAVVPSRSGGGSSAPIDLLFDASGNLLVTSRQANQILRYGATSQFAFTVSLASATAVTTTVSYATADGTAISTGTNPNYTAVSGTLNFPPGLTSQTIVVQTLDDGLADPSRYFTVTLSNPVGGVITTGQAVGTILDDTKFYVVDGGSNAQTYQYAPTGAALGNDPLGDTAPRGVATTAAGTTEWVVDANKTVYVYSTGGTLLGSWSAGGLSSTAALTGIATNGTDIWLVDSSADKVYKYAGAASRLSGSQSAASSFSLVSGKKGNSNPQDLVTDGTSFWVVDGTSLKVFKYTLSGSSLGSWTIDPANAHPTGITINPNNVSDVWIVDSGTLKVYDYAGAAGRTSGSQSAAASFALNPYDTNPQGIADPPPANTLLTPAAAPLAPGQPPAAAIDAASPVGPLTSAGVPSLAGRDALFALFTAKVDGPAPIADHAATPAGPPNALALLTSIVGTSGPAFRSEGNAVGLLGGTLADDGPALVGVTDSLFAAPADDTATEQ
jgi:hypothetical protein